jgi:hypothetical protein
MKPFRPPFWTPVSYRSVSGARGETSSSRRSAASRYACGCAMSAPEREPSLAIRTLGPKNTLGGDTFAPSSDPVSIPHAIENRGVATRIERNWNPQVGGAFQRLPQVTGSARLNLSRWRHGFKSRWDYAGQSPYRGLAWAYGPALAPARPRGPHVAGCLPVWGLSGGQKRRSSSIPQAGRPRHRVTRPRNTVRRP